MAEITLGGNPVHTLGNLPKIGSKAPDFELTSVDLSEKSLEDFKGKTLILNIFPSIDTGTCATSVREFNKKAGELENCTVLCISKDLPFAQKRFCGAEGIDHVVMLSDFGTGRFGKDYQLEITDGPLKYLHSRAIIIIDAEGTIKYTEQVKEIANEPNYSEALKSI